MVICSGGGGIPVVVDHEQRCSYVEAVVDKDLAASMLATSIQERLFVIATDVDMVFVDFGKPTQKPLPIARLSEIKKLYDEGQFPPGTMGHLRQSVSPTYA